MNELTVSYSGIRHRLIRKIQDIKTDLSINNGCTYLNDAQHICDYLSLSLLYGDLPNEECALYSRDRGFILVDLHKGLSERISFSFFHEVSHHIIESDDKLYYQLTELSGMKDILDNIEEDLANVGAAEFLMPSDEIKALINQKGFSIKLFPEIFEKYPASRQAVLVQMAQCTSHQCILCLCTPTMDEHLHDRLMVEFSTSSSSTKYSMGKNFLIPLDHYLNHVSESNSFMTDRKAQIPYKKSKTIHKVNSEALFYEGKVYALFNLTDAPLSKSDAPTLF